MTHCPQNFLYHTEEKVFHIIRKTLAISVKSVNIVNKNSVNIYLCIFGSKVTFLITGGQPISAPQVMS